MTTKPENEITRLMRHAVQRIQRLRWVENRTLETMRMVGADQDQYDHYYALAETEHDAMYKPRPQPAKPQLRVVYSRD